MISFGLFEILKIACRPPRCLHKVQGGWEAGLRVETQRGRTGLEEVGEVVVHGGPTDSVDSEGLSGCSPWEA